MSNVLFVCVANSGRCVIAERLFRACRRPTGTTRAPPAARRAPHAHPQVLAALDEIGIDASDHVPHMLDDDDVEWADVVVATCDDACPVIPGKRYVNWHLPDPKGRPLDEVRAIRDDIESRVGAASSPSSTH